MNTTTDAESEKMRRGTEQASSGLRSARARLRGARLVHIRAPHGIPYHNSEQSTARGARVGAYNLINPTHSNEGTVTHHSTSDQAVCGEGAHTRVWRSPQQ